MKVLIDSDVLLDIALEREPWVEDSQSFLNFCQLGGAACVVAWHTLSNLYYWLSRKEEAEARAFIAGLLRFVEVVPTGSQDMKVALEQDMPDLEDAMQVAAALACGAERVVTRNLRHYRRSPVPAVTPTSFLASVAGGNEPSLG